MPNRVKVAEQSEIYGLSRIITDMADMPYLGMAFLTTHHKRYPDTILNLENKGFACYYINRNQHSTFLVLEAIYVAPEYRNQRIGTALMMKLDEIMADEGLDTIYLTAGANFETVHSYFKHHDYFVIRKQKEFVSEVVMLDAGETSNVIRLVAA